MRKLIFLLFLLPLLGYTQSRNEKVRILNSVVDLMNEASRLNQTYYFDAVQLSKALYQSKDKLNENYFYSDRSRHNGTTYYTGMEKTFRFKELLPDKNNQLPVYMADMIPYLEAREKVELLLKEKNKTAITPSISKQVTGYISATDSLFYVHTLLTNYIADKAFRTDNNFSTAKKLLEENSQWFEKCYSASAQLYSAIENYYVSALPLNKTHAEIQNAEKEIKLTLLVMDAWQNELYHGNNSLNKTHDAEIRALNKTGLSKDSLFLFKTKGYDHPNSGWWAHTRYRTFYTSMQSTAYWYATSSYSKEPFLKETEQHYNKFILSYNPTIENYNRFIEITDGKTFVEASSCCLGKEEVDTNQNVMLKKPRLLYQYSFIDADSPVSENSTSVIKDTSLDMRRQELINNALPHHLVYLLDASASMNEFERLIHLKESAKYLVKLQREKDRISMVSFSTKATTIIKNSPCNYKTEINSKIDLIQAAGGTNINDGMLKAFTLADSCMIVGGKNKILLITDGLFSMSKETLRLLKSFKDKQLELCIIYLGNSQSNTIEKEFKSICEKANGRFYNTNTIHLKDALLIEASE